MANLNKIQATLNEAPSSDINLLAVNGSMLQQVPISAIKTNSGNSSSGLAYTLSNDGTYYTVTGIGECTDTDIKIPPLYNGLPVTSIGDAVFRDCDSLVSVTIPDSVTSIGDRAFESCNSLVSVVIGDSVISIGDRAFYSCTSLTRIVIPDSVTSIGDRAFAWCRSLESVVIGDSVTSIGELAFFECNSLESVVIGDSVTSIGGSAFQYCSNLTSVIMPDGVTSISSSAFDNCSNLTIYCEAESQPEGWNSSWNSGNRPVVWGAALDFVGVNDKIVDHETRLTEVEDKLDYPYGKPSEGLAYTLSDDETYYSVTGIGKCTDKHIVIPAIYEGLPVKEIGDYAFDGCTSLISITIPNSITAIGAAFYDCKSLTSIEVDKNNQDYKSIEGNLYSKDGTKLIQYALGKSDISFKIPDNVVYIYDGAFYNCRSLEEINISNNVTSIGHEVFYDCTSLMRVTIPDSVTSIGYAAFYGCDSLIIYCETSKQPDGWNEEWNYSNYPVVWNYPLTELNSAKKPGVKIIPTTYSKLKYLRGNSLLTPGMFYRITDYVCTTSQENTRAMDNKFDIIVQALSSNTLSETAKADYHYEDDAPDGYFQKAGSGQTLNITWVCSLGAGGYEGNDNIIFGELGSEENNEGEVVPVLYKMLVDEETGETTIDYEDRLFYIGSYEFEGETYDRWRFIETGSAEEGNHTWDSDDKKFILTNHIVENNEFIISEASEAEALYTMYDDDNGSYIESSKGDTFVEASYGENNEGVVVPILYKTALDSFPETDYEDTFYYVGQYQYQGEIYDRWRKIEPSLGWDDSARIYALTNVVVENNQFMEGVVESNSSSGGANLPAWELKYCLDNDTTRFAWALEGQAITNLKVSDNDEALVRSPGQDGILGLNEPEYADYYYAWGNIVEEDYTLFVYSKNETLIDGEIVYNASDCEYQTAEVVEGKGVIYYMKDEHGNECPYDFKNIQFRRSPEWQEEHSSFVEDSLYLSVGDVEWFYTFSWVNEDLKVEDVTMRQDLINDEGLTIGTRYNIIGGKSSADEFKIGGAELPDNVFIDSYHYDIGNFYGCYFNTISNGCYNNTFGGDCRNNTLKGECSSNIFGRSAINVIVYPCVCNKDLSSIIQTVTSHVKIIMPTGTQEILV